MDRNEAQLLLDAWVYFDANPGEKFYDGLPGLPRDEFFRLMQVIAGTDDLVKAKIQLGQFTKGNLTATVPGTIIEKAKEEVLPSAKIDSAKRATDTVRSWIKNIQPKTAESVAEREVALAQVKAEVEKAETQTITPVEVKPTEVEPTTTPETVPAEPVAVGIQVTNPPGPIDNFRIRSAMMGAATKIAEKAPEKAVSLILLANGVTHTALEKKATETLSGKEQTAMLKIAKEIRGLTTDLSTYRDFEVMLARQAITPEKLTFLLGPEARLTQAQVAIFLNPQTGGVSSFVPHQSVVGKFFSDAGAQIFGGLRDKIAGKVLEKGLEKGAAALGGKAAAAAVGVAAGPPSWVVAAASFIPDAVSWIKRNGAKVAIALGSALFGLGFLAQGTAFAAAAPILMGGGGIMAGGGFIGASGGVGNALSKSANFASNVLGGVGSLAVASIATPLIATLVGLPIAVALILFIINSGAYLVPPAPTFESPFLTASINCSKEKAAVGVSGSPSSPIVKRAWQITSDLYQGFWCFWNRSPGDFPGDITSYPPNYPELFNETLFAQKPNPSRTEISNCGDCMFWCTYLIQKAYHESGNHSLAATLWSPTMQDDFIKRNKFKNVKEATPKNVVPGSVVFFKVASGPERTNHVGLVYSVNQDTIVYLQSNAPTKNGSLTFNKSGVGIQSPPGLGVVGIGLP